LEASSRRNWTARFREKRRSGRRKAGQKEEKGERRGSIKESEFPNKRGGGGGDRLSGVKKESKKRLRFKKSNRMDGQKKLKEPLSLRQWVGVQGKKRTLHEENGSDSRRGGREVKPCTCRPNTQVVAGGDQFIKGEGGSPGKHKKRKDYSKNGLDQKKS